MPDVIKWPGWLYNPETGAGEIFQSEDEVPEGWVEHRDLEPVEEAAEEEEAEVELTETDETAIKALMDENTKDELLDLLELMNEGRDEPIEFLDSWPKRPLAIAIHTNTEEGE
jgi:hypothetical protein